MPSSILVAVSLISVGYHHSNISGPHATFNMCKTNLTPNKPTTLAQLNFGTQSLSVATYLNVYDQPHSHVCSDQTKDQLKSVSFNVFNNNISAWTYKQQCMTQMYMPS